LISISLYADEFGRPGRLAFGGIRFWNSQAATAAQELREDMIQKAKAGHFQKGQEDDERKHIDKSNKVERTAFFTGRKSWGDRWRRVRSKLGT